MPKKNTKKHPSTAFNGERSQESRAPKTPGLTISKLDDARRNFLVQLHLPIQRIVVVVVGPVAFVLFGVFALLKDCWQGWVVFGGAVVMNLCWIGALQLFKKKLLNTSV